MMMKAYDLKVRFFSGSDVASGRAASNLSGALTEKGIEAEVVADESTQDAGTIVGIILGSAAIIEIARGIADYIRRYNVSDVEFEGKSGTVRLTNVHKKELTELIEKISEVVE